MEMSCAADDLSAWKLEDSGWCMREVSEVSVEVAPVKVLPLEATTPKDGLADEKSIVDTAKRLAYGSNIAIARLGNVKLQIKPSLRSGHVCFRIKRASVCACVEQLGIESTIFGVHLLRLQVDLQASEEDER